MDVTNNGNLGYDRYPRLLDVDPQYRQLRLLAKQLYAKLLSRASLSARSGSRFRDDRGIYVIYTVREACDTLGYGKDAISAAFCSLEEVGLISRRRVGYSAPYRIYVVDVLGTPDNPPNTRRNNPTDINRDNRPISGDYAAPRYSDDRYTDCIDNDTATTTDTQITALVQALHDDYPAHRRRSCSDIMRIVRQLAMSADDLRMAIRNLANYKQSYGWTKDQGQYIPGVRKWLCNGLWSITPTPYTSGGYLGRRELDEDELAAIKELFRD